MKPLRLFVFLFASLLLTACTKQPVATTPPPAEPDKIEEILRRYEEAVGGREAIDRIVSFHGKGTFSTSLTSATGTYEVWGKDPHKTLSIMTFPQSIVLKKGFDGTTRWIQTPAGTFVDDSPSEMAEVERDADIYLAGKIKTLYEQMRMEQNALLHGHQAYVVEGIPAKGPSDKLFFDMKDGLLMRWDMVMRNPKRGNVFVKIHLDDYRDVEGVKVPFKVRFSFESFSLTLTMDELKHNVAIDDRVFKKPAP